MNTEQNISQRLLALREKHGITQTELATRLGVSLSYIHQLESGKRTEPSTIFLNVITLWEKLEETNRKRQAPEATTETLKETPPLYQAGSHSLCPLLEPSIKRRLDDMISQSGFSESLILNTALDQFLTECETRKRNRQNKDD
jgi:transcriptional regulator with XRE-family HTH domain